MTGYMIRHRTTGEYSLGGARGFSRHKGRGKVWINIGHVKNHLHYNYYLHTRHDLQPLTFEQWLATQPWDVVEVQLVNERMYPISEVYANAR